VVRRGRIAVHEIGMAEMIRSPVEILRRGAYSGLHPVHGAVGGLRAGVGGMGRVGGDGIGSGVIGVGWQEVEWHVGVHHVHVDGGHARAG
jgi:hypothetical protein